MDVNQQVFFLQNYVVQKYFHLLKFLFTNIWDLTPFPVKLCEFFLLPSGPTTNIRITKMKIFILCFIYFKKVKINKFNQY